MNVEAESMNVTQRQSAVIPREATHASVTTVTVGTENSAPVLLFNPFLPNFDKTKSRF